jgi:hypothetical protein
VRRFESCRVSLCGIAIRDITRFDTPELTIEAFDHIYAFCGGRS